MSIYKNIVRPLLWHSKFKKRKAPRKKISEELMSIAYILKDGGIFACQKMRKAKQNQFVLKHFATQSADIV